jgi:hypothetical protein
MLMMSVINKQDSDHYHSRNRHRTIYIDTLNVSLIDFGMTDDKKKQLIESGRQGTLDYLRRVANKERKEYQYSFQKSCGEAVKVAILTGIICGFYTGIVEAGSSRISGVSTRVYSGINGILYGIPIFGLSAFIGEFSSRITTNSRISFFEKKTPEKRKAKEIILKTGVISAIFTGIAMGLMWKYLIKVISIGAQVSFLTLFVLCFRET